MTAQQALKIKQAIADYHSGIKKYVPAYLIIGRNGQTQYLEAIGVDMEKELVKFYPNIPMAFNQLDFPSFLELTQFAD